MPDLSGHTGMSQRSGCGRGNWACNEGGWYFFSTAVACGLCFTLATLDTAVDLFFTAVVCGLCSTLAASDTAVVTSLSHYWFVVDSHYCFGLGFVACGGGAGSGVWQRVLAGASAREPGPSIARRHHVFNLPICFQ